ncbi:MAG: PDZ domain-containing protein [Gemmataceae bacterium]|nr:PDZ domain-containing protein [Gemmataceae bacterium]MDW8265501.1 PDZ domain-containing protein [Gemmataceae bacterium]
MIRSVSLTLVPLLAFALMLTASASVAWAAETSRGYLGVLVAPAPEGKSGIEVKEVTPGGPADKAGLKVGDRIVKVGDQEVTDVDRFLRAVAARKPGDQLQLTIARGGAEQTLAATLGEWPDREFPPDFPPFPRLPGLRRPAYLGVQTQPLTAELKERLKVAVDAGAVVTEVVPNSPAARADLKRDDVITAVDGQPVKSPEDLRELVQKAGAGKEVTLQVVRGSEKLAVKARLRPGSFGFFLTPGEDRFPSVDVESVFDPWRRIRELERRVEELEKRLRELEKK